MACGGGIPLARRWCTAWRHALARALWQVVRNGTIHLFRQSGSRGAFPGRWSAALQYGSDTDYARVANRESQGVESYVNKRAKQRLIGVTILIVVVIGALIGLTRLGNASATPVSIADVISDKTLVGKQIEVTGAVVAGSWTSGASPFVFEIEDAEDKAAGRVRVVWNDQVPGSFGDGTSATVTGTIAQDGSIEAKYLVTKCPSKYESATGALTVNDVKSRADELAGATVKVSGRVVPGTIAPAGSAVRFQMADGADGANPLDVGFGGGLSDEVADGVTIVVTGSIESDGVFQATEVALEKQ